MHNCKTSLAISRRVLSLFAAVFTSKTIFILAFCSSLLGVYTSASSREVHEAHTHGVASLALAYENHALEIQFESPAISLLGFEHKPNTQEQIEKIANTKALLMSATKIFLFDGANCSAATPNVDVRGPAGYTQKHKDANGHHDEHHNKKGHHANQHKPTVSHSEVSAVYSFNCRDDEKLQSLSVALFEHFSGLEKIDVVWVTETQQGQSVLLAESPTVELR